MALTIEGNPGKPQLEDGRYEGRIVALEPRHVVGQDKSKSWDVIDIQISIDRGEDIKDIVTCSVGRNLTPLSHLGVLLKNFGQDVDAICSGKKKIDLESVLLDRDVTFLLKTKESTKYPGVVFGNPVWDTIKPLQSKL